MEEKQINPNQDPHLKLLCQIALLCNDAKLTIGDPTERALVAAAEKCGPREKSEKIPEPDIMEKAPRTPGESQSG